MKNIKVNLIEINSPAAVMAAIRKPYKTEVASIAMIKRITLSDKLQERHGSVLEHIHLSFDVLGSSRLELQEHMRHRIASPTVESTRFALKKLITDWNDIEGGDWIPANIMRRLELLRPFFVVPDISPLPPEIQMAFLESYVKTITVSLHNIRRLLDLNVPNDYTKYLINESLRVNFTWSINFRSFLNFLRLRDAPTAHFEIRHVAGLALEAVKPTWAYELIQ